jgi:shikimate dehydrogenase
LKKGIRIMSQIKKKFGLVGKQISYSFSRKYFSEKFKAMGLVQYEYVNYDLSSIEEFPVKVLADIEGIGGLNVTIPYKESIMAYLDEIDEQAAQIGAVNTIKILEGNKLKGYNTDAYGFEKSLRSGWKKHQNKALILGTGGASKAVAFVLDAMKIEYLFVSRKPSGSGIISYADLNKNIIREHQLIINCSPVGTFPHLDERPDIPYDFITDRHFLYDLIYNPEKTSFLKMGESKGAAIINGRSMLEFQAERAWMIWNS